jgi:hypothetical protein
LNLRIKERVKEDIDKMLEIGMIFPVEESNWIIPVIIWDKKERR